MRKITFLLSLSFILLAFLFISPLVHAQSSELYVSNSSGNTISVLDPSTGNTITTIPTGNTPRGIIYNGTYVYVINADGGSVTVINPITNSIVTTIQLSSQPENGAHMALSPDKKTLYVSDVNSNVYVVDTTTNTVTTTIGGFSDPDGLAISPDGSRLYVGNQNCCSGDPGFVSVLNTSDYSTITTIPVGQIPSGIAISADGSKVYVTNCGYADDGNTVSVIDTATNAVTQTITGVASCPYSITINNAGTKAYVAGNNYFIGGGTQTANAFVTVIDLVTNSVITQIPVGFVSDYVALSSDDSIAYSTNEFSDNLSVIDTATNTVTTKFATGSRPWGVALIPSPSTKNDCKNDGWKNLTDNNGNPFKNQGECVRFFEQSH